MKRLLGIAVSALILVGCGGGPPANSEIDEQIDAVADGLPARVDSVTGPLPIHGDLAEGHAGDWILQNGYLAAVVTGLQESRGFALSGGNLIDAAPIGGGDALRELFTYFDDTFPRQAVYTELGPDTADTTAAVLVARGHDVENHDLVVETRYRLESGSRFLEIITTIVNQGDSLIAGFELGDAVQWGKAEPFAPGPGSALRGTRARLPWLGATGEGSGYLIAGVDSVGGPHGGSWSDLIYDVSDLVPGEPVTYRRRLFVVPGSVAEAQHKWIHSRGGPEPAVLQVGVRSASGTGIAGAVVEARREGYVELQAVTGADGTATLRLAPGSYRVDASHPWRGHAFATNVRATLGKTREESLVFADPARVHLSAAAAGKASPAKWTILGREGTPDPRFGPEWESPGLNVVLTPSGKGDLVLPAGTYRVVASRGPAWSIWDQEVTVAAGDSTAWSAVLEAVPGSEAWQSADLHVHALPSPDSNVSPADRLRSAACEGLDWFVSTDHGARTSYAGLLDGLYSAAPVGVLVGEEVTTPTRGHFTAFPLPPSEVSPVSRFEQVPDILAGLRRDAPQGLVMINHPRARGDGYFAREDLIAPGRPLTETAAGFDLLEIANGKRPGDTQRVLQDWFTLLKGGSRLTGVGNSDSHGLTGDPPGYPRNLVPAAATADSLLARLREGAVVVSNGPYIAASIRGRGPGQFVDISGHEAILDVQVFAADWVDVSRVTILVNGVANKVFPVRERSRPLRFSEQVSLFLDGSSFVQVRVDGEAFRAPVLGDAASRPFAVTNPIWVDIPRASR